MKTKLIDLYLDNYLRTEYELNWLIHFAEEISIECEGEYKEIEDFILKIKEAKYKFHEAMSEKLKENIDAEMKDYDYYADLADAKLLCRFS